MKRLYASRLTMSLASLAAAGLVLAGCGDTPPEDEADDAALQVVTAFYPLHFLAERVGGELVSAEDLTPPGADPHDLEIAPATVAVMEQSDVVVYLTGFQPAVDAGVEQISGPVTLDLAEVVDLRDTSGTVHTHEHDDDGHDHDHGPLDPHFWLDPERMATAADAVAEAYAEAAPEHAEEFEAGAAQLRSELADLDAEYQETLRSCTDDVMVVSHLAFGYLAERYDLRQVGIAGLDPHLEPSPARLAEIRRTVEAEDVSTIFVDPLASARVSEALAEELDLEVLTLDSAENLHPPADDYLEVVENNLHALNEGLGCQ